MEEAHQIRVVSRVIAHQQEVHKSICIIFQQHVIQFLFIFQRNLEQMDSSFLCRRFQDSLNPGLYFTTKFSRSNVSLLSPDSRLVTRSPVEMYRLPVRSLGHGHELVTHRYSRRFSCMLFLKLSSMATSYRVSPLIAVWPTTSNKIAGNEMENNLCFNGLLC